MTLFLDTLCTAHFPFQAISFRRGIRWPPRHYCDKRTFLWDLLPSWKWRRIPMQKRVADDLDFLWHTAGRSINDDVIHFLKLTIINISFHYIIVMKGIPPGFIAFLRMKTYSHVVTSCRWLGLFMSSPQMTLYSVLGATSIDTCFHY